MKKFFFVIIVITPFLIFSKPLKLNDINLVIERLFDYHIEYKKIDGILVSRSFHIYIDQFDPMKIYLLESDIQEYLDLNKKKADQIAQKVRNGDFSDYLYLNNIFKKSIIRARNNRTILIKTLLESDIEIDKIEKKCELCKN